MLQSLVLSFVLPKLTNNALTNCMDQQSIHILHICFHNCKPKCKKLKTSKTHCIIVGIKKLHSSDPIGAFYNDTRSIVGFQHILLFLAYTDLSPFQFEWFLLRSLIDTNLGQPFQRVSQRSILLPLL